VLATKVLQYMILVSVLTCIICSVEMAVVVNRYVIEVVPGQSSTPRIIVGGVMFQADVDNRSNFPTERSFHTFKKQRFTANESFYVVQSA